MIIVGSKSFHLLLYMLYLAIMVKIADLAIHNLMVVGIIIFMDKDFAITYMGMVGYFKPKTASSYQA